MPRQGDQIQRQGWQSIFYHLVDLFHVIPLSQVVYFTATFPYVLLVAITAYGLTLPGALDGVKELFVPKAWTGPKTITDPQVWRKAAEQMFYSLSVCFVVET